MEKFDPVVFDEGHYIGSGAYGTVKKHLHKPSGTNVAIKHCIYDDTGIPYWVLREMHLLQLLCIQNHPNIVKLLGWFMTSGHENGEECNTIGMVFTLMDFDLRKYIIENYMEKCMPIYEIKHYMRQLAEGLDFCHSSNVLHRDLKPNNLLLSGIVPGYGRVLKIADFGLGRLENNVDNDYTNRVVTLSYRGPEIILGYRKYDCGIDMWSVGCIAMEMYTSKITFGGCEEETVLVNVFKMKGHPGEDYKKRFLHKSKIEIWIQATQLYNNTIALPIKKRAINRDDSSDELVSIVDMLFDYDPSSRPKARDLLSCDFLRY